MQEYMKVEFAEEFDVDFDRPHEPVLVIDMNLNNEYMLPDDTSPENPRFRCWLRPLIQISFAKAVEQAKTWWNEEGWVTHVIIGCQADNFGMVFGFWRERVLKSAVKEEVTGGS